ncbi:MAG TPA: hypothetical protein VGQ46_21745 [Thermoanaerobaculia bacterium]|jgi:hypothetical protein|nr:hypothetical protein [Thermoanaerobaculia bacterium]
MRRTGGWSFPGATSQWDGRVTYQRPNPNTLFIDGVLGGRNIQALCHLEPTPAFLLTTRGFHWINEFPFNR